jgi:deoxyadenosine/deoxycytidine kinase
MNLYRNIAIEGNIGAGKTLLAKKLSLDLQANLILERFAENPFLARFYNHPENFAFQAELSFMLDRYEQLTEELSLNTGLTTVSDYTFGKSLLFARINLQPEEFEIYGNLFSILSRDILKPEIIIYLHNNPVELKNNIRSRGREYELMIEEAYLDRIETSYREFLEGVNNIPVLYIDVSRNNVLDDAFYSQILHSLENKWADGISILHFNPA